MRRGERRNSKDCGARALSTACNLLGKDVPFHQIDELAKPQSHGVSLLTLKRAAEGVGLRAYLLRTNYSGLCSLAKPVIVHLRWNHFDVVLKCDTRAVKLAGRRWWGENPPWWFKIEWTGIVMVLSLK